VDPAGQIRLNGCVESELALGDELQNRRCNKGFGDAGGTDMRLRSEPGLRFDVGVAGGGAGDVGAVADDGHAAGQVVAGHDLGHRVVDGSGLDAGTRAGQCEQKKNDTDRCDAH